MQPIKPLLTLVAVGATVGSSLVASTASAARYRCAEEHHFCRAPAGAMIYYGARGAYTYRISPPGGLPCNDRVFGDPLVGQYKHCNVVY